MKKIVSILMSSALLLGLVGCNSANNNQQGTSNPTNQNIEVTVTDKTLETTQETETEYQAYLLDGMTGEEIFNLLVSFSKDIKTGDTMENYPSRFAVEPYPDSNFSNGGYYYAFWGGNNINYMQNRPRFSNYIDGVGVEIQKEMDGTITVKEYSRVSISLVLEDYAIASDVYDRLYNYIVQAFAGSEYEQYIYDNREGTRWASGWESYMVMMSANEYGGYSIEVGLPIV